MNSFQKLHSALRYHIVNTLGWSDLHPTQQQAIAPVQAGGNALLLAPTAGGKTEAAAFPLLSRAASEGWAGLSILYFCPLKALLNNLEPRLTQYSGFVGRRAGIWHGDVGASARKRMLRDPPDVLLTTPESLEAILVSSRVDHRSLLGKVRAVVADELHAFAGDDRGWHLLALLARLEHLIGRPLQRVGLSATVGNPDELLAWFTGGRDGVVVGGGSGPPTGDVLADHVGSLDNAVTVISRLHRGERRLVFADSRARVEELASGLRASGVRTFVSHSSISADERRQAEAAFANEPDCAIVATSTLELGIDVGNLDRVIQIGAAPSVASFLQRMGRTGRRSGTTRNCLFLAMDETELLLALGLCRLWREGTIEHVTPAPRPAHLFAQQVMALALQEGGIVRHELQSWLGSTFDVLASSDKERVLEHMLSTGMLHADAGILGLGPRAEREFGRRHFGDLVVSFSSPLVLTVMLGSEELGTVHPLAVVPPRAGGPPVILLAGRSWRVVEVDWPRRRATVVRADGEGRARWLGGGRPASFAVCRAAEAVIADGELACQLSRRAAEKLDDVRERLGFIDGTSIPIVSDGAGNVRFWTFAGGLTNSALVQAMPGAAARADDFSIVVREGDVRSASVTFANLNPSAALPFVSEEMIQGLKFGSCLPETLATAVVQERLLDIAGIENTLSRKRRQIISD